MSILIVKNESEAFYDSSLPLETQTSDCKEIVINYEPEDKGIQHFLSEVERLSKMGAVKRLNIKVNHNNHVFGFKVKQRIRKATNDITLNEIIKLMVLSHAETDKKLEDMITCLSRI